MGKLQSDKDFVLSHPSNGPKKPQDVSGDIPPKIPPRMKKKGPALPEKPPHIRAKSSSQQQQQQPSLREPLRPMVLNLDKPPGGGTQREVLVAASKSGRERPIEKRQREPAKLLMPTSGRKELVMPSIHLDDAAVVKPKKDYSGTSSQFNAILRLEQILPSKKDASTTTSKNPLWSYSSLDEKKKFLLDHNRSSSPVVRKSRQPVLLIPRNLLTWGGSGVPISYALWTQRDVGRGGSVVVKPIIRQGQVQSSKSSPETSATSAVRLRSNSVARSGSLTSQGSSGSDSGGETFPKSVLKKQRRAAAATTSNSSHSHSSKGSHSGSNRRVDQKKNVTFNAFATVQLMEE